MPRQPAASASCDKESISWVTPVNSGQQPEQSHAPTNRGMSPGSLRPRAIACGRFRPLRHNHHRGAKRLANSSAVPEGGALHGRHSATPHPSEACQQSAAQKGSPAGSLCGDDPRGHARLAVLGVEADDAAEAVHALQRVRRAQRRRPREQQGAAAGRLLGRGSDARAEEENAVGSAADEDRGLRGRGGRAEGQDPVGEGKVENPGVSGGEEEGWAGPCDGGDGQRAEADGGKERVRAKREGGDDEEVVVDDEKPLQRERGRVLGWEGDGRGPSR